MRKLGSLVLFLTLWAFLVGAGLLSEYSTCTDIPHQTGVPSRWTNSTCEVYRNGAWVRLPPAP